MREATAPVGVRVGRNVLLLRQDQARTLRELSDGLAEVGCPISLGQLSKLEQGRRKVDVDELVALALVLNVTPAQLLMPAVLSVPGVPRETRDGPMPASPPHGAVQLAPNVSASWHRAWQWMCGDSWPDDARRPRDDEAEYEWYAAARPHDPTGVFNFSPNELRGHEAAMAKVVSASREAIARGLSARRLVMALDWHLAVSPEGQLPVEGE